MPVSGSSNVFKVCQLRLVDNNRTCQNEFVIFMTIKGDEPERRLMRIGIYYLLLDGMLVHRRVTPSIKFAGTHFYIWAERPCESSVLSKNRAQCTWLGLEPGPLDPETNTLTMFFCRPK